MDSNTFMDIKNGVIVTIDSKTGRDSEIKPILITRKQQKIKSSYTTHWKEHKKLSLKYQFKKATIFCFLQKSEKYFP